MTHTCSASYRFLPVGQGLFAAGSVRINSSPSLWWTYDCGTLTSQSLIDRELSQLVSEIRVDRGGATDRPSVELAVISHFDKDHISGIVRLLGQVRVATLMLPYMPLHERLIEARLAAVDSADPEMAFFINPVEYILNSADGPRQFLFVLPSDTKPPEPDDTGGDVVSPRNPNNLELQPYPPANPNAVIDPSTAADHANFRAAARPGTVVNMLQSGGTLRYQNAWEFVPYNDAEVPKAHTAQPRHDFSAAVEKQRAVLLNGPHNARGPALTQLRTEYDKQFGKSGIQRNIISLFLYAAPLANGHRPSREVQRLPVGVGRSRRGMANTGRLAVQYSGDAFLHTVGELDRFTTYLGSRINRIGCFQVMHHGAEGNWHHSVASRISPDIAVFAADPRGTHKHPHDAVVDDFDRHSLYPTYLVNTTRGLMMNIEWTPPAVP